MALIAQEREHGASFDEAREKVRRRVVFTTHTPVPAGNETYSGDEIRRSSPAWHGAWAATWNVSCPWAASTPPVATNPLA